MTRMVQVSTLLGAGILIAGIAFLLAKSYTHEHKRSISGRGAMPAVATNHQRDEQWLTIGWQPIVDEDRNFETYHPHTIVFEDPSGREHNAFVACKKPNMSMIENRAHILELRESQQLTTIYFVSCLTEQGPNS